MDVLKKFTSEFTLPSSDDEIREVLNSQNISCVNNFILGPEGTNISQASRIWLKKMGIDHKTRHKFCKSPEESVSSAKREQSNDNICFFWTCAVYNKENEIFFGNPDS